MPSPAHHPFANKRVYVAGHRGMVGGALTRALAPQNAKIITRSSTELDLLDQVAVQKFFRSENPEVVFFAAGKVGGIHANNTYPAEFIYQNLAMATNAIHAAYQCGVQRFLYLGSTCIYPRMAPQPIVESSLLTGPLEQTNEPYAIAKIAGLKLCQYYRKQYGVLFHSAMPTNLYGPGDNYHPENSHVLPAMICRFHEAKINGDSSVTIWGTGTPLREFLHVDDLAGALLHLALLDNPPDWINVGSGQEVTILKLAQIVAGVVEFKGEILTDSTRPDGTPRKVTDISRIKETGWVPTIDLAPGISATYQAFLREQMNRTLRGR